MKRPLLIALACSTAMIAVADNAGKINAKGNIMIADYRLEMIESPYKALSESAPTVGAIVQLNDTVGETFLTDKGYEVTPIVSNIYVVKMPLDEVEALAGYDEVASIEIGGEQQPMMNFAREYSNATEAQNGIEYNGNTTKYDGTGIVVGMMDSGLQPCHRNFYEDNGNGALRVKRLWHLGGSDGSFTEYTTDELTNRLTTFTCDTNTSSHGTHVAGIMAGSFNGEGSYYDVANQTTATPVSSGSTLATGPLPYYGLATGADLALSCSASLTDANILVGIRKVIEYGEEVNKPTVVNVSLGSNIGSHDGCSTFGKALGELGKRGIICVAAGNEGADKISYKKSFTASSNTVSTCVTDANSGSSITTTVDVWASDSQTLTVSWGALNTSTGKVTPFVTSTEPGTTKVTTSNTDFSTGFSAGTVSLTTRLSSTNNRYQAYSSISGVTPRSGYRLALIVEGTAGQDVYLYCTDAATFTSGGGSGFVSGNTNNTINDLACADNIVVVGAYNTRKYFGTIGTESNGTVSGRNISNYPSITVGDLASFSSYGTKFPDTQLPHVCAPGATIVSSYNRYYVSNNNSAANMTAKVGAGTSIDYWGQMQGTSMATPFVTGTVALWLQANPSLTVDDVLSIINETSIEQLGNAKKWGAGIIDVTAGLKEALQRNSGVGTILADPDKSLVIDNLGDRNYNIYVAGESRLKATLYALNGATIASVSAQGDEVNLDASALKAGVYILAIDGNNTRLTRKFVVK